MNFDFDLLGKVKYWTTLSVIVVIIGWVILATPLVAPDLRDSSWPWLNLGLDFQGGAQLTIPFEERVSTAEIRDLLAGSSEYSSLSDSQIQSEVKSNQIIISLDESLPQDTDIRGALTDTLEEQGFAIEEGGIRPEEGEEETKITIPFKDNVTVSQLQNTLSNDDRFDPLMEGNFTSEVTSSTFSLSSKTDIPTEQVNRLLSELENKYGVVEEEAEVNSVGQQISQEFQNDALQAIGLALLVILIYISWRFRLRYAVGAVVAVIHDVTIALAIFALFSIEINLPTIGAFLTIVGYSLNDTIVYFDRMRENSEKRAARSMTTFALINKSINQSLSRTLSTSTTTFIPVIALVLFGGPVLKAFSLALLIGVIVGTYSSIYVASPVVYLWDRYLSSE